MKGRHRQRKHGHVHAACGFCDWEKCPGDMPPMTMAGFYLVHVIDAHWDLVERIHASTGYPELRAQVIAQAAELLR